MTHSDQRAPTPSSSLDHVIQESSADTIHMRLGLLVAVLAHVVLFAANWPSFARSATPAPEKQLPIVVLRHFTYTIPPTPLKDTDLMYIGFMAAEEAKNTLMRCFTSVRDVGGATIGLAMAIDDGLIDGPR